MKRILEFFLAAILCIAAIPCSVNCTVPVGAGNKTKYFQLPLEIDQGSNLIAAAFAVRRLSDDYKGPCLRAHLSSGAEQDIGFTSNGDLDVGALLLFGTVNSVYVSKWYNQKTIGLDMSQNTLANMPQILNAGSLLTVNGRPTLNFNNNQFFSLASNISGTILSINAVTQATSNANFLVVASIGSSGNGGIGFKISSGNTGYEVTKFGITDEDNATSGNAILDIYSYLQQSDKTYKIYRNGSLLFSTSDTSTPSAGTGGMIGYAGGSIYHFVGNISEVLMYNKLVTPPFQNADESSQGAYYNIPGI